MGDSSKIKNDKDESMIGHQSTGHWQAYGDGCDMWSLSMHCLGMIIN